MTVVQLSFLHDDEEGEFHVLGGLVGIYGPEAVDSTADPPTADPAEVCLAGVDQLTYLLTYLLTGTAVGSMAMPTSETETGVNE